MATLLKDNAYGTLASGLTTGDTTLNFTSGHGARFPTVTAPDVLYCCILNTSNVLEEVIITDHAAAADSCTITRGAGSTTAKAWSAGDRIEARVSSTVLGNLVSQGTSALTVNVQGGGDGQVVYQVGTSSTGFVLGTTSDILVSNGTGAPSFIPRDTMNVGIASTATVALSASTATLANSASNWSGGWARPNYIENNANGYIAGTGVSSLVFGASVTAMSLPTPQQGQILFITSTGVLSNNAANIYYNPGNGFQISSVIGTGQAILLGHASGWYKLR